MMPASNRGPGMNFGFPDVCLTPAAPAPIPIPYPDLGMHAMAAPFCVKTLLTMMPALNMGAKPTMTSGMEGGAAHPMFKMPGGHTMGNPKILYEGLPAIHLALPTYGNNFNNPIGAVLAPDVVNTLLCSRAVAERVASEGPLQGAEVMATVAELLDELSRSAGESGVLTKGVGYVRPGPLAYETGPWLAGFLRDRLAEEAETLVVDLRGNPGGEFVGFQRVAELIVDEGAVLAVEVDGDGDELTHRSRSARVFEGRVVLVVDEATASAAELLAACAQDHGHAVVGERTVGKGSGQTVATPRQGGAAAYVTSVVFRRPSGESVDGVGVTPDVIVGAEEDALATALEVARRA